MRQKLVVGNWKMQGSRASAQALVEGIKRGISKVKTTQVAVCPPAILLDEVATLLKGSPIAWGGQNLCSEPAGAYTGELSGEMLQEFGCRYVIVGHSERRTLYNETDAVVVRKYARAIESGLSPIFCLGEQLAEREAGQTESVIARQLDALLKGPGTAALQQGVIAYEPVWAIGTGRTATPEQAEEVHGFIRLQLARHADAIANNIRILYGGSVKADNAPDLFSRPDIDGGLIGGASLVAGDFLAICQATR